MTVLLIVESPNKAKKIKGFFPAYQVVATVGHFQELPLKELGISLENHKPLWQVAAEKEKVVKAIRGAAKTADVIYVATDPDREGEAIAGHVVNLLGKAHQSKISRITYTEVSKAAINKAIAAKRAVDWRLVQAQEARRVLDRYIGYLVSPELSQKFKAVGVYIGSLSAGRVQSVAVRLIVERQHEIEQFQSAQHYGVRAMLSQSGISFPSAWVPALKPGELMTDKKRADVVIANTKALQVIKLDSKHRRIAPPPPLTTSTYVQLMSAKLKMTTKQAMDAAQKLFESGLITYHRTDSPTMSDEFIATVRDFAKRNRLPIPGAARIYKASDAAQAGHECLRVTDIDLINPRAAGVDDSTLQAVYRWVWQISLECQLEDGVNLDAQVDYDNGHGDVFITKASVIKQPGWRGAAQSLSQNTSVDESEEDSAESSDAVATHLPALKQGDTLPCHLVELVVKKTKPPASYTERSLVAKLDSLGIGRPSTYASVMERIVTMEYVSRQNKTLKLSSTPKGVVLVKALKGCYSFLDYKYTAVLEAALDQIASRKAEYFPVVNDAYQLLTHEINQFKLGILPGELVDHLKSLPQAQATKPKDVPVNKTVNALFKPAPGEPCPTCKAGVLTVKKLAGGKNAGKPFVGCSKFPACKYFTWIQ